MAERSSRYYPLFLDLEGRIAVVVGGGDVAARKIESLMQSGARVVVIAPDLTADVEQWSSDGRIDVRRRRYDPSDLEGAVVVIAATNDAAANNQIAADCRSRKILVNVVDNTPLCDFIVPAVIASGSVQVAVSTGGHSPALARKIKRDLQHLLGEEYSELGDILGTLREPARQALRTDDDRKKFFDDVIASGALELLRDGRRDEAYAAVERVCEAAGVPAGELVRSRAARGVR